MGENKNDRKEKSFEEKTGTFPTFRGLLRGAICNRSQAQFASEAGISAEHLNRMLNGKSINRPSKTTLQKLASAAMNGIRYQDFVNALDSDEGVEETCENEPVSAEAIPFDIFADKTYADLAEAFSKESPQLYDSVDQFLEKVFRSIDGGNRICYDLGLIRPYFGNKEDFAKIPGISYALIDFSISDEKRLLSDPKVAESEGIIYLTENELFAGKVLVYGVSMENRDLFDITGLTAKMFRDDAEKELLYGEESDPDGMVKGLEEILNHKYNLRISDPLPSRRQRSGSEMLDLILSKHSRENSMIQAVRGQGFETKEISNECLLFFLKYHRKTILRLAAQKGSDVEKLEKAIMEDRSVGVALTEISDLWLGEIGYQSVRDNILDLVCAVISEETGFQFEFYLNPMHYEEKELIEIYKDFLEDMDWIVVDEETISSQKIRQNTLLNVIARYCRELGVKTFGEMRFYIVDSRLGKRVTYRINQKDVITEEESPVDTKDWKPSSEHPKQTGLHEILLKDGRILRSLFVNGSWLARHKDFSNMVDKWNPEELKE